MRTLITMLVTLAGMIPAGGADAVSEHLQDTSKIPDTASCWVPANVSTVTSKGNIKPMSIMDDTENCDSLRFKVWNYGAGQWQQCYDTTMKFIVTCYNDFWAPSMFQDFSGALPPLATADSSLWLKARQWLESVLYLNTTNPEYFCACLDAIGGTFHSPSDTTQTLLWEEENRQLALARWEIENTTCDTPFLQNQFNATRSTQYQEWLNDTTVPFDTTIPPLDSVSAGLDTLLARHFLYASVSETPQPSIISNATANPNPTGEGTVISFGISQEAYVKIELFDILGHEVGSAGFESLFEPGNKSVPLSLAGLPSGTYFGRILTAYGEAQSVKLVKE